jgi:hypothetical protein
LINRLLAADYPDGTQALLEQHRDQVDPELVEMMQLMSQDLGTRGRENLSQRLDEIRRQALTLVESDPDQAA